MKRIIAVASAAFCLTALSAFAQGFRESNRLVFISFGSRELANRNPAFGGDPKVETDKAAESGLNAHFYVSEGTAHEWQSWRRSLYEFAQLLFR